MALNYKKQKNLVRSPSEYNRYYGDFRGVDFSSEETEVHEQRFAYAQNMYKDYHSSEGNVIETIPGFRRRTKLDGNAHINGCYKWKGGLFLHIGTKLYCVNDTDLASFVTLDYSYEVHHNNPHYLLDIASTFVEYNGMLLIFAGNGIVRVRQGADGFGADQLPGNSLHTPYIYKDIGASGSINISNFEYEQKNLLQNAYIHSYISREPTSNITEYALYSTDQVMSVDMVRNSTQSRTPFVKVTNEEDLKATDADGKYMIKDGVLRMHAGGRGANEYTVEVKYKKSDEQQNIDSNKIRKCTIATIFDGRLFVSGNPEHPNTIWYCGYDNTLGVPDATYFGELDYIQDGSDGAISCMMVVSDTLAVLKSNARQSSSIYFHARHETGEPLIPVTYPSNGSIGGLGEIYACTNFRDDPIFVSELGVEAIGQLSVRLERAMEHRSSLIDAKLLNCDLSKAKLAEWEGYLVVLVPGGKIFLADSRQRYTHSSGVMQYEWYYLEGIGIYDTYTTEYCYEPYIDGIDEDYMLEVDGVSYPIGIATNIYNYTENKAEDLRRSPVTPDERHGDPEGMITAPVISESINGRTFYFTLRDTWDGHSYDIYGNVATVKKAILVKQSGGQIGTGTFYPATSIYNIDRNLFFGTDNGYVCSFNFDMRKDDGEMLIDAYTFDGRTIHCGVATKLDNCGIPHLTKSTIKKSTVLKTKTMDDSAAKVRVRTNNKGYQSVARVNSGIFNEEDMNFGDYSFVGDQKNIFAIKEKEKHWVEKQHWIYSDEFKKPFSLHYLAFRYKVSGRIK